MISSSRLKEYLGEWFPRVILAMISSINISKKRKKQERKKDENKEAKTEGRKGGRELLNG